MLFPVNRKKSKHIANQPLSILSLKIEMRISALFASSIWVKNGANLYANRAKFMSIICHCLVKILLLKETVFLANKKVFVIPQNKANLFCTKDKTGHYKYISKMIQLVIFQTLHFTKRTDIVLCSPAKHTVTIHLCQISKIPFGQCVLSVTC